MRGGSSLEPEDDDRSAQGMHAFLRQLGDDERVLATVIQTVGSKGYDGFAIALVTDPR